MCKIVIKSSRLFFYFILFEQNIPHRFYFFGILKFFLTISSELPNLSQTQGLFQNQNKRAHIFYLFLLRRTVQKSFKKAIRFLLLSYFFVFDRNTTCQNSLIFFNHSLVKNKCKCFCLTKTVNK